MIVCKGIRKSGKLQHCKFIYDGNWGDTALVEHEKFHNENMTHDEFWLGFDVPQFFGKFSGRDGKRE
ncbi:hypothetical protein [Nitrosopumilus sp. K4]|uniref:hypothetical protein n=1 Tax=Nitrosopumilus sp. K4 TaxID=2795383 RepID=UPI0020139AA3|nr:hypothetical protein [Nitrosopumilus sp. K4]